MTGLSRPALSPRPSPPDYGPTAMVILAVLRRLGAPADRLAIAEAVALAHGWRPSRVRLLGGLAELVAKGAAVETVTDGVCRWAAS